MIVAKYVFLSVMNIRSYELFIYLRSCINHSCTFYLHLLQSERARDHSMWYLLCFCVQRLHLETVYILL